MNVKRIYPESKTGLINWIEENFHEIDQFVVTFSMKNGHTMTVYDAYTYLEAVGLTGISLDTIHNTAHEDRFIPKQQMKKLAEFVIPDKPWETVKFEWGTAVRYRPSGKWHTLFLSPEGQEIDVKHLKVELHENGIEFKV